MSIKVNFDKDVVLRSKNVLVQPKRVKYCLSMGNLGRSSSPVQQNGEMALSHSRYHQ